MAKRSASKGSRKKTHASHTASTDLGKISTTALAREMSRRQREIDKLRRRREKLIEQLSAVDAELGELDQFSAGLGGGGGRGRARNSQSLADALANLLKNRVMSVTEAADAVQAAGYQTTSANFRTIVNQTLIKDERFENVERGKYTVA